MGLDGFMAGCLSAIYSPQARVRRGFVISTPASAISQCLSRFGACGHGVAKSHPILSNVHSPD